MHPSRFPFRRTPVNAFLLAAGVLGHSLAMAGTAVAPGPGRSESHAASPHPPGQPAQAPNILIIMLDDAGYAQADTFGGEIHTPTLTRIADSGIAYNTFHTTAISSATRASLLTGRNHHRVGNGTVTEAAVEGLDGYSGVIPATAATIPQVLKQKGYASAIFGKWHNTPTDEAGPRGPFAHWPTRYGFDHFYGFLGGESDQYHPNLFNDTKPVTLPPNPRYHLTEDLAEQAITWLDQQQKTSPGQPFFMYWAPGGVHAPHQVFPEWSDRYKGKFDSGWDAYRQRVFERQKALGWIPKDAINTPRPQEIPAWNDVPANEKPFHARQMEVFAGFLEHTDTQAGKIVDELERLGLRENTLIFYVFSDNGASSEGMQGSINDLVGLNGITVPPQKSIQALNTMYGGLNALGGPLLSSHYSAAWAWGGMTPLVGTKLMAGYFGGTRVPMAISWPAKIRPDKAIRTQFHHVNDIAPTIYEVVGLTPPAAVNGITQLPVDGVSMAYTFGDAAAKPRKTRQYFEIMGSRAEYSDHWVASVAGPRKPWVADQSSLLSWSGKLSFLLHSPWIGNTFGWMKWNPEDDEWALFDLNKDFSQSTDVARRNPEKLQALKQQFDRDAQDNNVLPIGASFIRVFDRKQTDQTEWHFGADYARQPEIAAPNIKSRDNVVMVDADFPEKANGVLFKLGNTSAGITLFVKDGYLIYEYNGYSLDRTIVRSPARVPAGRATVSVALSMTSHLPRSPADVSLRINRQEVATGRVPITAPIAFTATGTLDVGKDEGAPVSLEYVKQAPFAFDGKIRDVTIRYE